MTDPDLLAAVAIELASRVRDEPADANARWLTAQLPDPADWFRLAFVLAAAIPEDRTWRQLTAWTLTAGRCQLSASGHHRRGERACPDCLRRDRARKRAERHPAERRAA